MQRLFHFKLVSIIALLFACLAFTSVHADTITCAIGSSCSASPEVVTVAAIVSTLPTLDPDNGEGPGGGYQSGVRFSGFAYPRATVTVQKSGVDTTTIIADENGAFSVVIPGTARQFFTLFATDTAGRRSTILNFPTILYSGYLTDISGIRFAPTIATDKLSVKQGEFVRIYGSALPAIPMEILFDTTDTILTLTADQRGNYSITTPVRFAYGEYTLKIHYVGDTRMSKLIRIVVGPATIPREEAVTNIPGDCNVDQRVTLVDFSVLAYWFGKPNPPRCVDTNNDGIINLVDLSILAFYWSS